MKINLENKHIESAKDISFLYHWMFVLVEYSKFINIIELIKLPIYRITKRQSNHDRAVKYCNIAIPVFILAKWLFIVIIILTGSTTPTLTIIFWYLIFNNLHTYFLNHLWEARFEYPVQAFRRRFLNLIQAICFSNIAFAYLYTYPYLSSFKRLENFEYQPFFSELRFSLANSISNTNHNYFDLNHLSLEASNITVVQLILTFVFVTILLATSLSPPIPHNK